MDFFGGMYIIYVNKLAQMCSRRYGSIDLCILKKRSAERERERGGRVTCNDGFC